jgi:hypothetical protein
MKKIPPAVTALFLSCLFLIAGCDKPLAGLVTEKLDELRSVHTIFVTRYPSLTVFTEGDVEDEKVLTGEGAAQKWEKAGLEVSGISGQSRAPFLLSWRDYDITAIAPSEREYALYAYTLTVELKDKHRYPDGVKTYFDITILPDDEGEYEAVRYISEFSGTYSDDEVYYKTLGRAIEDANKIPISTDETHFIKILKNINLNAGIKIENDIALEPGDDGGAKTIRRAGETGSLFTVESGATLKFLGYGDGLVIDGGKNEGLEPNAALVTVNGGTLELGYNVKLQNNNSAGSLGGAVFVNGGLFTMNSGSITGNVAGSATGGGGAAAVLNGGYFEMKGGVISDNEGYWGGGVWVEGGGKFKMENGSITGNSACKAGAVSIGDTGSFEFTDGILEHNKAENEGNGVTLYGGALFIMSGGAVVAQDNEVYLGGTDGSISVNVPLAPPNGYSAKIKPHAGAGAGTVVLTGTDGYQLTDGDVGKFTLDEGWKDNKFIILFDGNNSGTLAINNQDT